MFEIFLIYLYFSSVTLLAEHSFSKEPETANIAVVVCKQRSDEALVMVKSALVFRGLLKLHFIIFSELELQEKLRIKVRHLVIDCIISHSSGILPRFLCFSLIK